MEACTEDCRSERLLLQVNSDARIYAHGDPIAAFLGGLEFITPRFQIVSNFLLAFICCSVFTDHIENGFAVGLCLTNVGIEEFKIFPTRGQQPAAISLFPLHPALWPDAWTVSSVGLLPGP